LKKYSILDGEGINYNISLNGGDNRSRRGLGRIEKK